MNLSKKLWEDNIYLAEKSLQTKFVQNLKSGTLPKEKFQLYVVQDYFFLECFARAYGLAVSKAQDKQMIKLLSELLLGVSQELVLHDSYAKKWGINLKFKSIEPATKNYTDFLKEVSQQNNLIEIMCAMAPCMRLYAWIGKSLENDVINNPYKEWIETYSDKSFENLAKKLENLIDNSTQSSKGHNLNYFYKKAMELELGFFNAYSDF
mgnify:FL=1|tara:strand:+ start:758 stop:1381 length:624 start_codon:yes stop_codon:yes gene_type:complete